MMRASALTVSAPRVEPLAVFERLFAEYQTPLLNYLYRLVGDAPLAEDLVQEAFTRAWRARAQLPQLANPRAWLYRIATNVARDHHRRRRLLQWLPLFSADPALTTPPPDGDPLATEHLRRALLQLSPDYREPLVLYTCQDFSVAEIATALGLSPDAVKQRLSRARQKLRALVEESDSQIVK